MLRRTLFSSAAILFLLIAINTSAQTRSRTGIEDRSAEVNGVRLHYLVIGNGEPVIFPHGYAQNSHMWKPLMVELSKSHKVVAPDLRGFGQSSKPIAGYDKKTMARDVHALATFLGFRRATILPGVGDWKTVWLLRDLWHFHFYGETPLRLVNGRERIYFEHFWE